MKFLNKKGGAEESQYNWLLGTIVGVAIALIIGTVFVQFYLTQIRAGDSFDYLLDNITALEDGKVGSTLYQLPDSYILVSFNQSQIGQPGYWVCPTAGNLPVKEYDLQLNRPSVCGDQPCICACKLQLFQSTLSPNGCSSQGSFCRTLDTDYEVEVVDPQCPYGLFMPGPTAGVIKIDYERKGNKIYFCSEAGCADEILRPVVEEEPEAVDDPFGSA